MNAATFTRGNAARLGREESGVVIETISLRPAKWALAGTAWPLTRKVTSLAAIRSIRMNCATAHGCHPETTP